MQSNMRKNSVAAASDRHIRPLLCAASMVMWSDAAVGRCAAIGDRIQFAGTARG